jgi:hypothetical protein
LTALFWVITLEGVIRTLEEHNIKMDISKVGNEGGDKKSSSGYGSMP